VIKLANNLHALKAHQTQSGFTKQALIATTISALAHGLTAPEDKARMSRILRGAAKGLGADVGALLGAWNGAALGAGTTNALYGLSTDISNRVKDVATYGALGGLVGAGGGGVGGYLLADKLLSMMDNKPTKAKD
jgi:hypothetical protein